MGEEELQADEELLLEEEQGAGDADEGLRALETQAGPDPREEGYVDRLPTFFMVSLDANGEPIVELSFGTYCNPVDFGAMLYLLQTKALLPPVVDMLKESGEKEWCDQVRSTLADCFRKADDHYRKRPVISPAAMVAKLKGLELD